MLMIAYGFIYICGYFFCSFLLALTYETKSSWQKEPEPTILLGFALASIFWPFTMMVVLAHHSAEVHKRFGIPMEEHHAKKRDEV
jgi:hypothetical protein